MKTTMRVTARVLTALLLVAGVGFIGWWDYNSPREPLLTGASSPAVRHIQIADAQTVLACPGQPVLASLGEDEPGDSSDDESQDDEPPVGTYDPEYAPDPGDAISRINAISVGLDDTAPAPTTLDPLKARDEQTPTATVELSGSGAVRNGEMTSQPPVSLRAVAHADSDQTPLVTGVRYGAATEGDLRGIAASPCIPIAAEQWLIGGQTEAGSSAKLELMNPSQTAATVRLELWGAAGPLNPVGSSSVLVPPGEHRSILLEGLAPGERRIAVRVQSSGARIAAVIQDVRTLGLRPAGVDYVAPSAPLDTVTAVAGLEITDGDATALRILVPGEEPGLVDIRLLGPEGEVAADDLLAREVPGGSVTDVSLAGIPPGSYTAVIEGDVPLTASGFIATEDEGLERDVAWMPGGELDTTHVFALPESEIELSQKLVLGAVAADALARVSYVTDGGEIIEGPQVVAQRGESRGVDVPSADGEDLIVGVIVSSDEPVAAGLALRTVDQLLEAVALLPATPRSILPSGVDVKNER